MELQRHLPAFESLGVRLFVVSYDDVEVLRAFAERYGITYPLLSDEGSRVIREFGILNTLVDPDEAVYGIPYPGIYAVGEAGRVERKFFHRLYQERDAASMLLRLGYGVVPDAPEAPSVAISADAVQVTAHLATPDLKPMQLTELYVTLDLPEGLHANARDLPEGYVPTAVTVLGPEGVDVGEPQYPPGGPFRVEGIPEVLSVYSGRVVIAVPLRSQLREGDTVTLDVEVRFQACNDRECFLPRTERLQLVAPIAPNVPGAS